MGAEVTVSEQASSGAPAGRRVLEALARVPTGRAPERAERRPLLPLTATWPPKTLELRSVADYWFVSAIPVDKDALQMELGSIDPAFDVNVLEVQGVENVRLVVVGVSRDLSTAAASGTDYLYYWRPRPNVTPGRYGPSYPETSLDKYPYTFDFGLYGIWNYLNYRADPLTYREERWVPDRLSVEARGAPGAREVEEKFSFGLPYQMRRAGRPFVLLQPVFGTGSHPGGLSEPKTSSALLDAVHAWVWRAREISERPAIGSVVMAGYSAAASAIARFAAENVNSDFIQNVTRDLLLFDPPAEANATFERHAGTLDQWAKAAPGKRRIALYSQVAFSALPRDLPKPPRTNAAFLADTGVWRFLFTPQRSWVEAQALARKADAERLFDAMKDLRSLGYDSSEDGSTTRANARAVVKQAASDEYAKANLIDSYFAVHFAIPAVLLTDALRTTPA